MCTSQSEISSKPIALTTTALEKMHHQRFLLPAFLLELVAVVALLLQLQLTSAGSCREAQLCCAGRDSSCVVQKTPINAIIEDLNDKPCYCDHACLKLGDCCGDFKDHCGVIDCQVSDWTAWSECDESCGTGITLRTRNMTQAPQNGGKHCPTLIQKRNCQGFRCHGERGKRILHGKCKQTALILPSSLAHIHGFNKSKEILWRRHDSKMYDTNEYVYCIEFEVIKAAKECHKFTPYSLIIEGDRVAVHCNKRGIYHKLNLRSDKINSTHHNEDNSYLPEYQLSGNTFQGGDSSTTTNGVVINPVSVMTPPLLPRSAVHDNGKVWDNARCRGEGVPGRATRFRALTSPSCRGKWLRLTLGTPKKCPHSKFVFV